MVNGDCATVKRFHQHGKTIALVLQSTNPEYVTQIYNPSDTKIDILGKVVTFEFTLQKTDDKLIYNRGIYYGII